MSLCIVDGYNFVFRAFHSLPPLTTSKDIPVGAVYGFINMLARLIEDNDCEMLAIALDSGKITFRNDIYPEYKAHRDEPDEALKIQFPIIREAIEAFGIKAIEVPGFEADDIIATYTTLALKNDFKVRVISSDKDLIQLMQDKVEIFDPLKKKHITSDIVLEKYGIKHTQMIDYLSLVGDASDNIPGVKKVGPKTAAKLLNQFNTLENAYDNIEKVEPVRIQALLNDSKKEAFLSKKLVTLDHEVKVPFNIEELKFTNIDEDKLSNFLNKYEFKSLNTKKLINSKNNSTNNVKTVNSKSISLDELCKLQLDIEKFGKFYFHVHENVFFCYFGDNLYKINLDNQLNLLSFEDKNNNSLNNIIQKLKKIFEDSSIKKVSFDTKSIIHICNNLDIKFISFDDISLLSYVLHTGKQKINLENLIEHYNISYKNYDAFCIYLLHDTLKSQLAKERKFEIYEAIEKPLLSLLVKIENKGIKVDKDLLVNLGIKFEKNLKLMQEEIYQLSDEEFNIGSPKQIGEILFDKLKLEGGKKSKKSGSYITDAETLEKHASSGILIAEKILEWRHYSKLISTYINALQKAINKSDGRIHTTFSLTTTSTARLSSHDPNLQNIPIRTNDGNQIRKAFIAKENHLIVSGDYSQIELRILADIANINSLKEAFKNKKDIHSITASQIFNIPLEEVNSEYRRKAKAINFGIIYGQSAYGLANSLQISREEAFSYIESYFKQYPGIKEYMDTTIQFAKKHGYVKTLMGRKCYVENINDRNYNLRNFAERAAINAPIQGTASEIIKKAMVSLSSKLQDFLILQIHDELLFEIPKNIVEESCIKIKNTMMNAFKLSIPIDVEISYGESWYDAK
ncbi:DNA polymerase I [Rickettsiales endosymbiont of Trichoplax sp. H2]|uniref:DNA polymerase I n=1 Tax=Rickettsiales endosymbiont of Trichoplax sp. H2 TaxID=2021221 RepID=UPI0012B3375F|nr:DNA polymerase I [Rickettsiales endosymbiont of Trichoplax sp. H2]MSO14294.1 DNA polymerase I [Rickettsiales endosymbiont of Trichoplax sp. H2]